MGLKKTFAPEVSIGLDPLLIFEYDKSKLATRWVVGKNGSKVELVEPEEFFNSLLEEDAARTWLRVVLTVAHRYQKWWRNAFSAPKIWLLTGIYLIEDAMVVSNVSNSSSGGVSSSIPVLDQAGIAAMLGLQVHGSVKLGNGSEVVAETQTLGKKVWAAQWQQVGSAYPTEKKGSWDPKGSSNRLKLLNVWSLDTERGEEDELELAEVDLSSESVSGEEETGVELGSDGLVEDESLLSKFDNDVDELLEEMME